MSNQHTKTKEKILASKEELIRLWSRHSSLASLAKTTGYSRETLAKYLTQWGVYKRKSIGSSSQVSHKKYPFKELNKESAYWLGFIQADGSIYPNGKGYLTSFELGLQSKDLDHLNKFCKFIDLNKKPTYRKNTDSYRICFKDKEFVNDLISLGIRHRKSYLDYDTSVIPSHLTLDFLRGVIDGDGHIGNTKQPVISVVCCKPIALLLKKTFNKGSIYKDKRHSEKTFIYSTTLAVKDEVLLEKMYHEDLTHLTRKKEMIDEILFTLATRYL